MSRWLIVVAATACSVLLLAPGARADTADILEPQQTPANEFDGWQAGPCTVDAPTKCSPNTPSQFFKTAGGHPPKAFVQFIVRHTVISPGEIEPLKPPLEGRIVKTIKVDLPPGLSINPSATPEKCSMADFLHQEGGNFFPQCKPGSVIGESQVNIVTEEPNFLGFPTGSRILKLLPGLTKVDLFNIEPDAGEPALFGFVAANSVHVFLRPEISWESDYHESFTIEGLPDFKTLRISGLLAPVAIHSDRLVSFGTAGDGTLATNPTTCFEADRPGFQHLYSSWIREDSFEQPDPAFPFGSTPFESAPPVGENPVGCENIPFDPSIELDPGADEVDSPAAPTVAVRLPVQVPAAGGPIAESHLRTAEVTLPKGLSLNPAGSAGLQACPDANFPKGDRNAGNTCPGDSVIGTAEIRTPVLPQTLTGSVFVGEPKSADPASGEEFRLFVEARSDQAGVVVRLIGKVKADPATGQLTASFDEQEVSPLFGALPHGLPQVPLESFTLRLDGAHKILTTPPTCGISTATSSMEPWARPGTHVSPSAQFALTSMPGGGECPATLGQRPFEPTYTANPDSTRAGAFSPFRVHIARLAGQQEIKRLDVNLPQGLIGKLRGVPYCSEAAIAAAAARSGGAERESPSCSFESLIGTTSTESGSGEELLKLPGNVYLAGPYKGAPLSLVVITPALSGPFDLGNVVIRAALSLDPATAQIRAVSDLIPDVFGGVKLDVRAIDIDLDRHHFILNPTSCAGQRPAGTLSGGGSDPANPAAFSAHGFSARFQASGCERLGFNPTLTTRLSGPTKRSGYPALTATLEAHDGDANLARVALTLPHDFFVAQEHITDVCTRPQLAAKACPPSSIYGQARATSPLLGGPLTGPVYLVPAGHDLPDLVVDLHGQVDVQLHGVVSSRSGGIETVFESTPDVPLREFVLEMAGGKKGLIVNSTNVCKSGHPAELSIAGQNGKVFEDNSYKLRIPGCERPQKHKKHKKHRKHGKHHKRQKH